jgi:hypothetical protein
MGIPGTNRDAAARGAECDVERFLLKAGAMSLTRIFCTGAVTLCIAACASSKNSAGELGGIGSSADAGASGKLPSFGGNGADQRGGAPVGAGGTTGAVTLPPEMKVKLDFEQPQASDRFVYAANPSAGTVSIINAETQVIQTLETGDKPTFLRTLAGTDDAIVLNAGSDDATILRSPGTGTKTSTVPVVRGANVIAVAPDGKHAVVYFNADYSAAGNTSGSFQDVTVLTLAAGADQAVGMTVGFKPRAVYFAADGSTAYAVTDDGISVLEFARVEKEGTGIARLVALGPNVDQQNLDVSVTPKGEYALTREPGKSVVRLIDLQSGQISSLDLASVLPMLAADGDSDAGSAAPAIPDVSDLALAPDGNFALAVVRDRGVVLKIPIPAAFSGAPVTSFSIDNELIGSATIAPSGEIALLYTTALEVERITILPLDGKTPPKTVAMRKSVKAVTVAPDGRTALIVHKKAFGDPAQPGIDPDLKLARSFGYSVLRVPEGDIKLQVTSSEPGSIAIVPDGSFLFLLFRDDAAGVREVQKIDAKSFLVQPILLGSPPISVGAVPRSKRVFVNQEHPDGRITFIDWDSNETRTVTGFALNSRIRD